MSEGPERAGAEAHQDEDDAEGGVQVVVVDVAPDQVEDAADDQGQGDEAEADGLCRRSREQAWREYTGALRSLRNARRAACPNLRLALAPASSSG